MVVIQSLGASENFSYCSLKCAHLLPGSGAEKGGAGGILIELV